MIIFSKITWQEFQIIIHLIEEYNLQNNNFNTLLPILKSTKKQWCNIGVDDLSKEDFHRILILLDMYNAISDDNYNEIYDQISSKLQRVYFKMFNEQALPED